MNHLKLSTLSLSFTLLFCANALAQTPDRKARECFSAVCRNPVETLEDSAFSLPRDIGANPCAAMPLVRGSIHINASKITPQELSKALACSPDLERVSIVDVTSEHLKVFARGASSRSVRELTLAGVSSPLSRESFESLDQLGRLTALKMSVLKFEEGAVQSMRMRLPAIETIIIEVPLEAGFADSLLSDDIIARLHHFEIFALNVGQNHPAMSEEKVCSVLSLGSQLRTLSVSTAARTPVQCDQISLPEVESILIHGIGDQTLTALRDATMPRLVGLGVIEPRLVEVDFDSLISAQWFSRLEALKVTHVDLTSARTYLLLGALPKLKHLSAVTCELGPDFISKLLDSGMAGRLELLNLRSANGLAAPPAPHHVWPSLEFLILDTIESRDDPMYRFGLCALGIEC